MGELIDSLGSSAFARWLEANGLDSDDVPARGGARIVGRFIEFRSYEKDAAGNWIADPETGAAKLTTWQRKRMKVAPHGR